MLKRIFYSLIVILFLVILIANVYFSQSLNPLFFNLAGRREKNDAVLFLKKIRRHQQFPQQLAYFKKIYGKEIEKEVFSDELKRKAEIKKLEEILLKNDKARDVLVKLAILYLEDGNRQKTKEYYQRAKVVDPFAFTNLSATLFSSLGIK